MPRFRPLMPDPCPESLPGACANPCPVTHSRYVQRIRRRYAHELGLLPEGAPRRAAMAQALAALKASGLE